MSPCPAVRQQKLPDLALWRLIFQRVFFSRGCLFSQTPVSCDAMLCCAVLCCAVLCFAMLCYAMPRYAVLCYAVLRCVTLCCAVLCCAVFYVVIVLLVYVMFRSVDMLLCLFRFNAVLFFCPGLVFSGALRVPVSRQARLPRAVLYIYIYIYML